MREKKLKKPIPDKSGALYEKMIEEIEDYAILLLNKNGNIINWNKGVEKIHGYSANEILRKNFSIFFTKKDKENKLPQKLIEKARKTGKSFTEGWLVTKDGQLRWMNTTITAIHDHQDTVIGFSSLTRDFTEKEKAQATLEQSAKTLAKLNEELRRSEERYQKMVQDVEDYAILLLDQDGYIESVNKGVEKIKGYKPDEIIGKNFKIFYTRSDARKGVPAKMLANAARYGKITVEGWRVRKDGSTFWGSVVITALRDNRGKIIGFSKVTRDLSDKKLVEDVRQLEEKNKELEQFAYVASHDLMEPLQTILSFVNIFRENYNSKLDDTAKKYLRFIDQASERMQTLVSSLLEYSLIGRTRILERVNCNKLLSNILTEIQPVVNDIQAIIKIRKLPLLEADSSELKILFSHLINNAIKFRREDKILRISISARKTKNYYEFAVKDNGIGIEEKYHEKIFSIFQRLHTGKDYEGTGVGLAHCIKIVRLYLGKMWVESKPGKGSTFYFTLPVTIYEKKT